MNTIGHKTSLNTDNFIRLAVDKKTTQLKSQNQEAAAQTPAVDQKQKAAGSSGVTVSISKEALENSRLSQGIAPIKDVQGLEKAMAKVTSAIDGGAEAPYALDSATAKIRQTQVTANYTGRFWDKAPAGVENNGQGVNTSGNDNSSGKISTGITKVTDLGKGGFGVVRRMDTLSTATDDAAAAENAGSSGKTAAARKPGSAGKAQKPGSAGKAPQSQETHDAKPAYVAPKPHKEQADDAGKVKTTEVQAQSTEPQDTSASDADADALAAAALEQAQQGIESVSTQTAANGPSEDAAGSTANPRTALEQSLYNIGVDLSKVDTEKKDAFGNTVFTVEFNGGLKRNAAPTDVDQTGVMKVAFTVTQKDGNFSVKASTAQDDMQVIIGKGAGADTYEGQVEAFGQALQFLNQGLIGS